MFTTVSLKIPFFRDTTLRSWVPGPRRYEERSLDIQASRSFETSGTDQYVTQRHTREE
jgi:hypothetical protein